MTSEFPGRLNTSGQEKSTTREPLAEASQLKAALDGFVTEIKTFRADVMGNLKEQDERLTMLDRKFSTKTARPVLAQGDAGEGLHLKAFDAYLRSGDDDALRGLVIEGKGMNTSVNSEGGYLVDPQTNARIQGVLFSSASIRAIASVVQVEAGSFDVLVDHGDVGSGWATEAGPTTETGNPAIDRISIKLHELSAMPKASQRLLEDSAFDVEGWLADRIAQKFARAEAASFISGDGVDKLATARIEAQERVDEERRAGLEYRLGKIEEELERLERRLWLAVYGVASGVVVHGALAFVAARF